MEESKTKEPPAQGEETTHVILAVDIGSSSVRCTAYACSLSSLATTTKEKEEETKQQSLIAAIPKCAASRTVRSVEPTTGHIRLTPSSQSSASLFDQVDECITETLKLLRQNFQSQSQSRGFRVVAVTFTSFVMNLIGVDQEGQVVEGAPSLSYACNVKGVADQCSLLRSELGNEKLHELHQQTGCPLHSSYALPQLRHYYSQPTPTTPSSSPQVYKWQTIPSLILHRWTKQVPIQNMPISYSEASWTGLLHAASCTYDATVLALLKKGGFDVGTLPALADYNGRCQDEKESYNIEEILRNGIPQYIPTNNDGNKDKVVNPYWDKWPELRGASSSPINTTTLHDSSQPWQHCRLFLGTGDGACANIGSKCTSPQRIAVTIGTSAAARVCLPCPISSNKEDCAMEVVPSGLFCYRVDAQRILVGGALTDGGSMVEFARNLLHLQDAQKFQECMKEVGELVAKDRRKQSIEGSGSGLTVVPFLGGERSTGYRNAATGCILGFTRDTTPAMFVKSCLEGVTLRLFAILQRLGQVVDRERKNRASKEAGNEKDSVDMANTTEEAESDTVILASGTALEKNFIWRQMIADCSGRTIMVDAEGGNESTSRGAALLALSALKNEVVNCAKVDALQVEEELVPVEVIRPSCHQEDQGENEGRSNGWKEAFEAQEELIDAVSPLWNS